MIVLAIIITWIIYAMLYKVFRAVFLAIPETSSYEGEYWNDAGDGSGVNYVQMPDGSVRID